MCRDRSRYGGGILPGEGFAFLYAREKRLAVPFIAMGLFLARLRLITARFLWTRFRYAVLLIFIATALLPSPDPWTQTVLAVPMLAMYVISIAVAWLAAPRKAAGPAVPPLRLVAAAAMLDQAWRCPNSAADS